MLWISLIVCLGVATALLLKHSGKGVGDLMEMVGLEGTAEESFSRSGSVFVRGEIWRATAERGIIQKGQRVKVIAVRAGLLLVVEGVKDQIIG